MNQEALVASVPAFRQAVEMQLLTSAVDAIHALNRVVNGEIVDSQLANAAVRAAVVALNASGFGPLSRHRKAPKAA
jgi:hypothetical protein